MHGRYLVLRQVLWHNLQLLWVWLLFAHTVFETRLAIRAQGRDDQEVGSRGCQDPVAVSARLQADDRITETWQQSLGVLTNLLVQADSSVHTTEG